MFQHTAARRRLIQSNQQFFFIGCFNTQPPEGGWAENEKRKQELAVSTHSRPKAAVLSSCRLQTLHRSFNTQPPEGGWNGLKKQENTSVCFNTQPPEGGCNLGQQAVKFQNGFNTQPPEGGCFLMRLSLGTLKMFQHTAARRRLRHN